jgi:RNA polymerase-binding transcription factor DksA
MRAEDQDTRGPRWRAILEARWRDRLQEVIELSGAYYAATADPAGGIEDPRARRLLRQAVAARQRLADTEGALARLTTGGFGRCEHCGTPIVPVLLAAAPETRYCIRCTTAEIAPGNGHKVRAAAPPPLVPAQRAAAGRP